MPKYNTKLVIIPKGSARTKRRVQSEEISPDSEKSNYMIILLFLGGCFIFLTTFLALSDHLTLTEISRLDLRRSSIW